MRAKYLALGFFVLFLSSSPLVSAGELPRLQNTIVFDECSHHSPQRELWVGATILGFDGIQIKTSTHYGTCVSYQIFDPSSEQVFLLGPEGPDCRLEGHGQREIQVFRNGQESYQQTIQDLFVTVSRLYQGSTCLEAHPELQDLLGFLEGLGGGRPLERF